MLASLIACGTLASLPQWCAAAAQDTPMTVSSIATESAALEKQWQPREPEAGAYFRKSAELIQKGTSTSAKEDPVARYAKLAEVAQNALGKDVARLQGVDRVPVYKAQADIAAALLGLDLSQVADPARMAGLRESFAQIENNYVSTLARVAKAMPDPGPITLNVAPPGGSTGGPAGAGMDPKDIKDPAARRKYEADIQANNARVAAANERSYLDRRVVELSRLLESWLRRQYARQPARDAELRQHLSALESARAAVSRK